MREEEEATSLRRTEDNADKMLHRGQYSDAVLSELESQNDDQVEGMSAKVKMLKDVSAESILPSGTLALPSEHSRMNAEFLSWGFNRSR